MMPSFPLMLPEKHTTTPGKDDKKYQSRTAGTADDGMNRRKKNGRKNGKRGGKQARGN
jgi:hypothetical protein